MSSFQPLTPDQLDDEAMALREAILTSRAAVVDRVGLLAPDGSLRGLFDPLLRTPAVGQAMQEFGLVVRTHSELGPAVCEAVILVVADDWNGSFEWNAHVTIARDGELLSEEDIDRIAAGTNPEDRRLGLASEFARQQVRSRRVDARTQAAVLEEFGERGVVELTLLIACYEMVCRLIRTCRPDPPIEDA